MTIANVILDTIWNAKQKQKIYWWILNIWTQKQYHLKLKKKRFIGSILNVYNKPERKDKYLNLKWSKELLLYGYSIVSDSLRLQHSRLPCLSPTPGACSNSCPLSWSCHLILYCPLLLPSIFPSVRVFPSESPLHIRWP